MPGTYTYPGVYVEEIPSGVRSIVGVSTSDTAFVDFFRRGPMNQAVRVTSLGDFERVFGGLDTRSEASYAIQQFFLNGGAVAWVVRVGAGAPGAAQVSLQGGSPLQDTLVVAAANPGQWGNNLQVAAVGAPAPDRFNLVVREVVMVNGRPQVLSSETHRNLSMNTGDPRYAVDVVNDASALVQITDGGLGDLPLASAPINAAGDPPESAFQALVGGGDGAIPDATALIGSPNAPKSGLYALDMIDPFVFNLLCLPAAANLQPAGMSQVMSTAQAYCESKRAFMIVDIPATVDSPAEMSTWMGANDGLRHRNAAVYFPRLRIPDPLNGSRLRDVGASGTLAGVYARTDSTRGIWKAPAGTDANLRGATLAVKITDLENGQLNPQGINALRTFPTVGNVSWGGRTLVGADQQASEWKYVPVRRMALYLEESLYQGLKWVVFEPNDEPLWSQVRLNVGAFMHNLFRQGAFQGKTPAEAYFVKCDKETTTQSDINLGIVNILVGFAPLKPAEFVVLKIQQMAGQVAA